MGHCGISDIDSIPGDHEPPNSGGTPSREEWVRANFTQIFGTSAHDLQAQGIDPRRYASDHRDEIRRFAGAQRRQGIAVPGGGPGAGAPSYRGGYRRYGGGPFGMGARGGAAWIGILVAFFALRFLLVDSLVGRHAAIYWVLAIGGILLAVRIFLFSWLRRRRFNRPPSGRRPDGQAGT
jgi:hypothetical protein